LAGWRASQSALSEGALWRCFRHQQQQWTAAAVVPSRSLLPGVDSPACSYIFNANIDCPPNIWSTDHQPIRIRTTTLLKVLTNNFINYDKIPARPLSDSGHDAGPVIDSMTMDDRICANNTNFNIYFQNIDGMRTKAQSLFQATSHGDHDVIIFAQYGFHR